RDAQARTRSTLFARGQRSRRLHDAREHARGVLRRARVAKRGRPVILERKCSGEAGASLPTSLAESPTGLQAAGLTECVPIRFSPCRRFSAFFRQFRRLARSPTNRSTRGT